MLCSLCSFTLTNIRNANYYNCDLFKAIILDKKYYLSIDEEKATYKTHNNGVLDLAIITSPLL